MQTKRELRVLIAPDKFKGSLRAVEAGQWIGEGVTAACVELSLALKLRILPLADGGEGSLDVLRTLQPAWETLSGEFHGVDGASRKVLWLRDPGEACEYLETAALLGRGTATELPSILERDSRGVGEWIRQRSTQSQRLYLMLGGSLSSDGGFGLAVVLGFEFFSSSGTKISRFADVELAHRVQWKHGPQLAPIVALSDVTAPLCGPRGAVARFAQQKGASAAEQQILARRLEHLARLIESDAGGDANRAGAGAAGGLCFPLTVPDLDFQFRSGIDFFLDQAQFAGTVEEFQPQLTICAEGRADLSSIEGKAPGGVFRALRNAGNQGPVLFLAGQAPEAELLLERSRAEGIDWQLFNTVELLGPGEGAEWRDRAGPRLAESARLAVHKVLAGQAGASLR